MRIRVLTRGTLPLYRLYPAGRGHEDEASYPPSPPSSPSPARDGIYRRRFHHREQREGERERGRRSVKHVSSLSLFSVMGKDEREGERERYSRRKGGGKGRGIERENGDFVSVGT